MEWMKETLMIEKNIEEDLGGGLYTFGSYEMDVHGPGGDIDAIVVVPLHIERDKHFFGTLATKLKSRPEVSKLVEVKETLVPIIKLVLNDIDFDLLFARLAIKKITEECTLMNDNILKNVDYQSILSLNGC